VVPGGSATGITAIPAALAPRDSPSSAAEKAAILLRELTRNDFGLSGFTNGMCARAGMLIPFDQFHQQRPIFHTVDLRDVRAMERGEHFRLSREASQPLRSLTSV
jgi:hypothetical protein